jgi:hypothetical protein
MGNTIRPVLKKNDYRSIVAVLTLLSYVFLFLLRSLDDNRLTSWESAFLHVDGAYVFLIVLGGIVISFFISRISLPPVNRSLFLFCLSFGAAALFWREPEVIVDSARYFTQAKYLEMYGVEYFLREWGHSISAWTDMPLVPFLYGLIFRYFGESRTYIQIFTTTLFSLTAVITYGIGRKLWSEEVGFFSGLLLLGMPYLLTQAPLMLVDVPTMFFFMLAVYTFIGALESGGSMIFFSALSIFLAVFSKYSTWLMLSVLVIIFLVYLIMSLKRSASGGTGGDFRNPELGCSSGRYAARGAAVLGISGLLIGTALMLKYDVVLSQITFLLAYQKPGLERWGESFFSTFFFQISPFITIAAIYSVYAAWREKDPKFIIIAWLIVLVILLRIRRIRYIIMALPMLSLMASYGLRRIRDKSVVSFITISAVIFSLIIGQFAFAPLMQKMSYINLKAAGYYLDTIAEKDIEVITLTPADPVVNMVVALPILDLFTGKNVIYRHDSVAGQSPDDLASSSLRFTWEYRIPDYYTGTKRKGGNPAVVIISDRADSELPDSVRESLSGYILARAFSEDNGIFRFKTFVRIYRKDNG